jgi:hypothetical protein
MQRAIGAWWATFQSETAPVAAAHRMRPGASLRRSQSGGRLRTAETRAGRRWCRRGGRSSPGRRSAKVRRCLPGADRRGNSASVLTSKPSRSPKFLIAGRVVPSAHLNPLHAPIGVGRLVRNVLIDAGTHTRLSGRFRGVLRIDRPRKDERRRWRRLDCRWRGHRRRWC